MQEGRMRIGRSIGFLIITTVFIAAIGWYLIYSIPENENKNILPRFTIPNQESLIPTQPVIPRPEIPSHQETHEPVPLGKLFYKENGITIEHYWPGSGSLGEDESEMLVYNEGEFRIEFISPDMIYFVNNQPYTQESGTWETFPARGSWERLEHINIKPGLYQGEPLLLEPGKKGKIHYHYQLPLLQKQAQKVKISLTFNVAGEEVHIDTELTRSS